MILVIGDLHGLYVYLNELMKKYKDCLEMVLSVGELGYFPGFDKRPMDKLIVHREFPIYFCDGNHEDFVFLRSLQDGRSGKNIFYMRRGSLKILPDGRTVLFMGGAFSTDWPNRKVGVDWFPEYETIQESDLIGLPNVPVDIVISHTAPTLFPAITDSGNTAVNDGNYYDPSREALDYVFEKYHPKEWYFGHFHNYKEGYFEGCNWTELSNVPKDGWYKVLE